jgi:predicted TIM-barrel fold metal-dependent hydrolase
MDNPPVLFDANAYFGRPANSPADVPTLAARLAHMNRLGIARSLVWNSDARQHNALASNRQLLDEIARTPGARGRIVPALTVSGLLTYEAGGIRAFLDQMQEGDTRALRFTTVYGRLTLGQIEPVILAVRSRRPFLVMQYSDTTPQDVLDFTAQFPDVPIILTNLIWGHGIAVFDLMRRRPNILVETSWLHTWEALRLAVRHFSADRLVFGMGYKSHNGAAIAALACAADLTPDQRRQIGSGNLDRLTGLQTTHDLLSAAATAGAGDTYWKKMLSGRPLGADLVDAHGHLGPSAGYVLEQQREEAQIPEALRVMDRLGAGTMIVAGMHALMSAPVEGNELLENVLRGHHDRIQGYVAFNPRYGAELAAQLDRYFSGSFFVGFKLLCGYWGVKLTDPRLQPMWDYAQQHRLPVLMHTWGGGLDTPAMLPDTVRRYPDVAFLLGHSGGGDDGRAEAEALALEFPNVYLEWCGSFCSTVCWEDTLRRIKPRQVVYGTDAMAHDINWELGRLLSVDVPDEVLTPILGANMRRILAQRR